MKLLQIISSVNPEDGGVIEGVRQQCKIAGESGVEMHVACLDSPDEAYVRDFPGKVFALGTTARTSWRRKTPWGRYRYEPGFAIWLRDNIAKYDAVIVNGLWNYTAMAAKATLVNSGVPYVVFTHGMLDPWFRKTYPVKTFAKQMFWHFCEGPLLNNADAVFFTTAHEMIVSDHAFRPYHVKGRVVGFGTSDVPGDRQAQARAFRTALPALGERPFLLYLSRIHPKKGIDLLIQTFATIARDHPGLDLVIAGPDQIGWQADLEKLAEKIGIARRIHWPGMLGGDEKWGAFKDCAAFVLPSHQENFGVVVAEALACAKAVLISDKVQIWQEVAAHNAGLVKPDTLVGTCELLQEFARLGEADIAAMGHNARTLFESNFSIEQAFGNVTSALAEIVSQKAA